MLPHQLSAIDVVAVVPRVRRRRTDYCRAGAVGMRIRFVTGWNLFSCALRLAIISHGFGIEVWNNVSESLQIIRLTYFDGVWCLHILSLDQLFLGESLFL